MGSNLGILEDKLGVKHLTGQSQSAMESGAWGEAVRVGNGNALSRASQSLTTANVPMSVGAWINPSTVAGVTAFYSTSRFAGSGVDRFQFDQNAGTLRWIAVGTTATGFGTKSGLVANAWQHCLGVETTTASRFSAVNGVAGTVDTTSAAIAGSIDTTMIGCMSNDGSYQVPFSGLIGEICVWNRSFTTAEAVYIADLGLRYELWYPLRSPRWISFPAAAGLIKTRNGLAWASVKTVDGLAAASVKTINGLAAN